jgi:hypothetical protein
MLTFPLLSGRRSKARVDHFELQADRLKVRIHRSLSLATGQEVFLYTTSPLTAQSHALEKAEDLTFQKASATPPICSKAKYLMGNRT